MLNKDIELLLSQVKELTIELVEHVDNLTFDFCPSLLKKRQALLEHLASKISVNNNPVEISTYKEMLLWIQEQDNACRPLVEEQRNASLKSLNHQNKSKKAIATYKSI